MISHYENSGKLESKHGSLGEGLCRPSWVLTFTSFRKSKYEGLRREGLRREGLRREVDEGFPSPLLK